MRRRYLTNLNDWIKSEDRTPLILRGARQVGKSYLVNDFAKKSGLNFYEINLEKHSHLEAVFATLNIETILKNLSVILQQEIKVEGSLLFLDEIQATPSAIAALRYFYEAIPQLAVICAGSLLEFALSEHSFSMPVGRIEYLHISPLTWQEYLCAAGAEFVLEQLQNYHIEESFPAALHQQCLEHYQKYLFTGGMPKAVDLAIQKKTNAEVVRVQNRIQQTYSDDFSKYAKGKTDIHLLQKLYRSLPATLGKKFVYVNVARDEKSRDIRRCLELLRQAGIIRMIHHCSAPGVPLAASQDDQIFKVFWLDVGLYNRALGLNWHSPEFSDLSKLIDGPMAEQFIAQHLHYFYGDDIVPELHYWLREGKAHNAEVDFVVSVGSTIVPVEVKSGTSGSLRSLLQFVAQKNSQLALRFDLNKPSVTNVVHRVVTSTQPKQVEFKLLSLPIYMVGESRRLIGEAQQLRGH